MAKVAPASSTVALSHDMTVDRFVRCLWKCIYGTELDDTR
jgi:hypothetical protein